MKPKGKKGAVSARNSRRAASGKNKKKKTSRGYSRYKLPSVVVILVLFCIVVWHFTRDGDRSGQAQMPARPPALTEVVDTYLAQKPVDEWWLTVVPPLEPGEEAIEVANHSAALAEQIARLLSKWQNVSPLAGDVAKTFPSFWVTFFNSGISTSITVGEDPEKVRLPHTYSIEICFIPRDQFFPYRLPGHFYYRQEWGALMMAALEYPEPVLAGLVFHELGHAYRHRQATASSVAPQFSDLWIMEEVEMHELEAQIFDAVSAGAFLAHMDAILARPPRPRNIYEAVNRLRLEDFRYFDAMLGTRDCGPILRAILSAQYILSLGFRYIDQSVPTGKRLGHKIALYRWWTTAF